MIKTASVWIMNKNGEFLVQLRSSEMSNNPNTWGNSAGGQIDAYETPLQAVKRETLEELGLAIPESDFIFLGDFPGTINGGNPKHMWLYFVNGDYEIKDMTPNKNEISRIEYLKLDDIKRMIGKSSCSIKTEKIVLLENYLKKQVIK